jgi:hypothetical protein
MPSATVPSEESNVVAIGSTCPTCVFRCGFDAEVWSAVEANTTGGPVPGRCRRMDLVHQTADEQDATAAPFQMLLGTSGLGTAV